MRGLLNTDKATFFTDNRFEFPHLLSVYDIPSPDSWIDFDCAFSHRLDKDLRDIGLHFYVDDYKFERIWRNPDKYIEFLQKFHVVIQPDFSMYYDFPVALQIYNKYRNHWLACYYDAHGVSVIPNISPAHYDSFDWVFDGYPKNSVVAFSDFGCVRLAEANYIIRDGFKEMVNRLSPMRVLYFTRSPKNAPSLDFVDIIEIPYFRRKRGGD